MGLKRCATLQCSVSHLRSSRLPVVPPHPPPTPTPPPPQPAAAGSDMSPTPSAPPMSYAPVTFSTAMPVTCSRGRNSAGGAALGESGGDAGDGGGSTPQEEPRRSAWHKREASCTKLCTHVGRVGAVRKAPHRVVRHGPAAKGGGDLPVLIISCRSSHKGSRGGATWHDRAVADRAVADLAVADRGGPARVLGWPEIGAPPPHLCPSKLAPPHRTCALLPLRPSGHVACTLVRAVACKRKAQGGLHQAK